MKKIIYVLLLFVGVTFNFALAAELSLPLPSDANKTSENKANAGPVQTTIQLYTTRLSKNALTAFYKKQLIREGWAEEGKGIYTRAGYMAIIAVSPLGRKDKQTQFSITTANIPTKEDLQASSKEVPDKLDFMPVCPGSKQSFLWDMPSGVSASYESTKNINEAVFFFKSAMLGYGWSLSSEAPVTTQVVDCPECRKASGKSAAAELKLTSSRASLTFRKSNGDSCIIRLYQGIAEIDEQAAKQLASQPEQAGLDSLNKTTILVTYNDHKKISL